LGRHHRRRIAETGVTYLPPIVVEGTVFPEALGPDAITAIRMIEERWERMYPLVHYTMIDKKTTPVDSPATLSGEDGSSKFDTMWGESVDRKLTTWKQPQNNPEVAAAEVTVYQPSQQIRARIKREARENELKKFGFDRLRDLIVCIPCSLLDQKAITCQAGDRFTWNNETWEVIQHHVEGWWYNTNVNLYVWMNVQHARRGS
jgi:hypothetical protein